MNHRIPARHASLLVAAMTLLSIPLVAQNPSAPAPAAHAGMPCDSACRAGQGGMMEHQMPMGPMAGMQHDMMGNMGGMMACPMMPMMMSHMRGMMGNMGGMMQGRDGPGMGGMSGMGGMVPAPMAPAADSAAVRARAEQEATYTRAYYQALVGKGFTSAQALLIVAGQPGGR